MHLSPSHRCAQILSLALGLLAADCQTSAAQQAAAPAPPQAGGSNIAESLGPGWQAWFPAGAVLKAFKPGVADAEAGEITDRSGLVLGWAFRTDRMPPVVRGMRGEIGLLVGVGVDGQILGVRVLQQREDAKWFNRIQQPFYAAFSGRKADGSGGRPDTVTGATVSSGAMVRDVYDSCQTLLGLPAVKPRLTAPRLAP